MMFNLRPAFLNLGLAAPRTRGPAALAPRMKSVMPATHGHIPTRLPRTITPLLLTGHFLPVKAGIGQPFTAPPSKTPLTPNPFLSW